MICSRRSCGAEGAVCRHTQTGRMYCIPCARSINAHNPAIPPLVVVPERKGPPPENMMPIAPGSSTFSHQSFRSHNCSVVTAPPVFDQRLAALKSAMFCATNEQRIEAMADYCKHCGKSTVTEPCHCENEE